MSERRFRRVPFIAEATIAKAGESWVGELVDIALRGALVESGTQLPVSLGDHCRLNITLPGTCLALDFEAELVHHDVDHYGFKFLSENLETLTHLRKLIELNTGDTEATRNELTAWLKV